MRKLLYVVILVLVLVLTFRVQLSIKANPGEIHVPGDHEKIQWAIGNATTGDTIRVHAGTYYEHVVVDKQLSLIGDGIHTTTIDGNGIGPVVNITASHVLITGFTIRNSSISHPFEYGIIVEQSNNCQITNNYVENCGVGITARKCDNLQITGNTVTHCDYLYCILLINSSNSLVADNMVLDSLNYGITLTSGSDNNTVKNNRIENLFLWGMSIDSIDNTIYGNKFVNFENGMVIGMYSPSTCGNNDIFHNSFVNMSWYDAYESAPLSSPNAWDLGWPDGGNYWSNHTIIDVKSGPNQLGEGSDAISDTPYHFPIYNQDRFPCAGPIGYFEVDYNGLKEIPVISNSTVSDFQLNETEGTIKFNVSGDSGVGFCRVDLPNDLVSGLWQNSYKVLVDGVPINFGNWTAGSKTYIYFRYQHSTKEITIAPEGDEYFYTVVHTPFDDSGDGFHDSVEVTMDVDTTYNGSINVSVDAYLIDPNGIYVAFNTTSWTINYMDFDWGYVNLHVPPGYPIGNYSVELSLYDSSQLEDYRYDTDIAYLFPPFVRELTIETVNSGTTDPPPDSYMFPNGTQTFVQALPDDGWMLDYWMFDSVDVGSDNPISITMDNNHVLTAVFVEIPTEANVESCNSSGDQKDIFDLGETVYVTGTGYSPSATYDLYVVADMETWTDGMAIPERVPETATTVSSNTEGHIAPTAVWTTPQNVGKYDIVVDINGNGQYDAEIDALDDNDIELTAGFLIPEFTSSLILLLFMMATLLAVIVYRRKRTSEVKQHID